MCHASLSLASPSSPVDFSGDASKTGGRPWPEMEQPSVWVAALWWSWNDFCWDISHLGSLALKNSERHWGTDCFFFCVCLCSLVKWTRWCKFVYCIPIVKMCGCQRPLKISWFFRSLNLGCSVFCSWLLVVEHEASTGCRYVPIRRCAIPRHDIGILQSMISKLFDSFPGCYVQSTSFSCLFKAYMITCQHDSGYHVCVILLLSSRWSGIDFRLSSKTHLTIWEVLLMEEILHHLGCIKAL